MTPVFTFTATNGGTTNLPLPKDDQPFDSEYLGFGVQFRTFNATLKTQHLGSKWRRRVSWEGLSLAEKETLLTVYSGLLGSPYTITFPDGVSLSMQATIGSWIETVWFSPHDGTAYYNVTFQMEQV